MATMMALIPVVMIVAGIAAIALLARGLDPHRHHLWHR
jgi:hypothetical protein